MQLEAPPTCGLCNIPIRLGDVINTAVSGTVHQTCLTGRQVECRSCGKIRTCTPSGNWIHHHGLVWCDPGIPAAVRAATPVPPVMDIPPEPVMPHSGSPVPERYEL